jgi:hypothetical protein
MRRGLTAFAALPALALFAESTFADSDRRCETRQLTAAEQAASSELVQKLQAVLPPPPAGWKVRDDRSNAASGSCETQGRMVPQPVTIQVSRRYEPAERRPPPAANVAPAPSPPASQATAAENPRIKELEAQIKAIQLKDKDVQAAYFAARRSGDSERQQQAGNESRELRNQLRPLQRELSELRRAASQQRAAASADRTRVAQEKAAAARANRQDASVVMDVNLPQLNLRMGMPNRVSIAGVPIAVTESDRTYLLFGKWADPFSGGWMAALEESGATTRVQNVSVRIDASPDVTDHLLGALDKSAINRTVGSGATPAAKPAGARTSTAPARIDLRIAGSSYRADSGVTCKSAQGSLHGQPATQYQVRRSAAGDFFSLTAWKHKSGGPMTMSLSLSLRGSPYTVDTTKGSGKISFAPQGSGGSFTLDATSEKGDVIRGRIDCPAFATIEAEGG